MALTYNGFLGGKMQGRALEVGICFTASSAFLLFGYDQGVMSGIITEESFLNVFPKMASEYKSGAIQALVVAIYEIGCLIGSIMIIWLGDKLGRRRAVLLGTSIMLIGAAIQTSSFSLAQLIVGRIVTGIGNGANTSTIPVWQSEMAPPKIRGFLVLFEGALITLGVMISYWINYGFFFVTNHGSFQWRFPIAFQGFFALVLVIGILAFPESPRWLVKHGRKDEAARVLANLSATTPDDKQVKADIAEMQAINRITDGKKLTVREFLSNGREMNLWRASIACGAQAMQQIGGINLVTYYATVLFEQSLGFGPKLSRFLTAWLGTEYFIAACAALFFVDRLGRRRLMIIGAIGMAGSLVIIGATLSTGERGPAYAATVFVFVYNTFFALGWLGVTWLYPSEITPLRIRAEANGLSTSSNWIFNYAVVQLAPIMINTITWKTYFVFFCFNVLFIPIVYFFFPESNGYKLEMLDAIFAEAHEKGENPVFTEQRVRKHGAKLDIEQPAEENGGISELEKDNNGSRTIKAGVDEKEEIM